VFQNIKWLRLTPDRPGRGGTKTGIHSFQQEPINDVRSLTGGHVHQGAWRREFATVAYPTPQYSMPATVTPWALHGYVHPSLTDPAAAPSVSVLAHVYYSPDSNNHVVNVNDSSLPGGPYAPGNTSPAVFQNIGGRCFFGEGSSEGRIVDDRTPAIHAQRAQNLGIGTPRQPLTPADFGVGVGISPEGTGYVHQQGAAGVSYLNTPDPNSQLGTILSTDSVTLSVINPNYANYSYTVVGPLSPSVNAVTSNAALFTATGTISIVTGASLVTLTGATWPARYKYAGLRLNFNGYSFVILGTGDGATGIFDVNGNSAVLTTVQAYLLGVYDGPTITAPGVPYTITGCQVTFASAVSTLNTITSGVLGYSQSTHSLLVQIKMFALRASGLYRNLGNISLGPASGGTVPTSATTYTVLALPFTIQFSATGIGVNPIVNADIGKTIVVDQAGAGGTLFVATLDVPSTTNTVVPVTPNWSVAPLGPVRSFWGSDIVGVADAAMAITPAVTVTSASNPWTIYDVGKKIMVATTGDAGNVSALFATITVFNNAGSIDLDLPNLGAAVTNIQAFWGGGTSNTTTGPTYAYAWYDPETGHMSNISPLAQVPRPTIPGIYSDFANLATVFTVDPGMISFPSGLDALRFSHIMFFRTLSTPGSSTLYPIGSLNPFTGKVHPGSASTLGSWNPMMLQGWTGIPNTYLPGALATPPTPPTYWYDWSSDSDLLLSGGFRAPQFTNEKPMALLRGGVTQPGYPYAMAYWDRRLWIANTQEPDKIAFSCDDAQCPLGVPVESFPPTNFLRLPSVDGRVIGMRTVGDMLLVTTERWAYIIAGNNESNYRLMKVSSSMPGVGLYQMDEFPTYTGAEGEPTTLFYLGRDRIVYQWTVGGPVTPISQPIQDQLDKVLSGNTVSPAFTPLLEYQNSRVHCVSAWGRRLVVVVPAAWSETPSPGPLQVHFYDIANQVWSEGFFNIGGAAINGQSVAMTTVYGLDVPVNELFIIADPILNSTQVRSWLRDDLSGTTYPMTITTFPMNFDGKKTRKQIVALNLHATAGAWAASIYANEATAPVTAAFAAYPDPINSIYAPTSTPVDPNAQDISVMAAAFSNTAPVVGYRFSIQVQKNADTLPAKVYALDIGYVDYEEAGEGEA
jgi:hypothetical protein